jgi:hypothetical protein
MKIIKNTPTLTSVAQFFSPIYLSLRSINSYKGNKAIPNHIFVKRQRRVGFAGLHCQKTNSTFPGNLA